MADIESREARAVNFLAEHALEFRLQHPRGHLGYVLLHHGGSGADHPAVLGAGTHLFANLLRLFTEPDFLEVLGVVDVAHALLPVTRFQAIAGVDFAPRVRKEVHRAGFAREHSLAALNILDEAQVKERAEPRLRVIFLEQAVDKLANVVAEFFLIANLVVFLVEVVAVMEGCGRKFKVHRKGEFIKRNQVVAVPVAERLTEADILHAHFMERLESLHAAFKAVIAAAQEVVRPFEAFDTHANADIRETFRKLDDAIHPPAAGADDNARGLGVENFYDVFQILADKRFAAGHVRKLELRQNFQILRLDFFALLGRILPYVAHLAAHLATIRGNHRHISRHLNLRIALFARFAGHKSSILQVPCRQRRSVPQSCPSRNTRE